jgi:hypothetical protein
MRRTRAIREPGDHRDVAAMQVREGQRGIGRFHGSQYGIRRTGSKCEEFAFTKLHIYTHF